MSKIKPASDFVFEQMEARNYERVDIVKTDRQTIKETLIEEMEKIAYGTDMKNRRWIELPDCIELINKHLGV